MKMDDVKLLRDDGKRLDGRNAHELRPITMKAGVLDKADGSCYIEWGENKLMVGIFGPREAHPKHLQNPRKAVVLCKYQMAPYSVGERKKPGPDRRSIEISKILGEALSNVVLGEHYPRAGIEVYVDVLQAGAGTRCAALTAASIALADAGIPVKDLVSAVAVGKVDGKLVLDLDQREDNHGEADIPLAVVPRTGELILLQMDGHLTADEVAHAIEMGTEGCNRIYEMQKAALRARYDVSGGEEEVS